jgi:hypothetical protein
MNKLYITEIDQGNQKQENKNNNNNDIKVDKQQISSYLAKNQKVFHKTSDKMLDYLVNEETKFTDLQKIEDHFKYNMIIKNKLYNENNKTINEKENQLEGLELEIEQVII